MSQHILNCFEIKNAADLGQQYQLVEVDGPFNPEYGDGDLADRNLQQLLKNMQYQERAPVTIYNRGARPVLALPANRQLSRLSYDLAPDVATIRPLDQLRFCNPLADDPNDGRVGRAFLGWQIRSPFFGNNHFWSPSGSVYFPKTSLNFKHDIRDIDVYRGFGFRIDEIEGRVYIWVKLAHRYAETRWMLDAYTPADIQQTLQMRHALYHYGNRWFPIQLLGITGKSIQSQQFIPDGGTEPVTVLEYTLDAVGESGRQLSWIRSLNPNSVAISYRYPGNQKKRLGAAGLCKLLVPTEDSRTRDVHRWSIVDPQRRIEETKQIVLQHLQGARLGSTPIEIDVNPLRGRRSVFQVPVQLFGQEKQLIVGTRTAIGEVPLRDLGRARWDYLMDAEGGVAVTTPLDAQYIIAPDSLERAIVEDLQDRIEKTAQLLMKCSFSFSKLVYSTSNKRTLKQQFDSIAAAIEDSRIKSGRGILVLPNNADPHLHDLLKRKLRDRFQFQCVKAQKVEEFYQMMDRGQRMTFVVQDALNGRYRSYIRYVTMGLLLVNRQCPWVLANKTHYDLYIGIDVLRNTAAFTFLSQGGRRCHTKLIESKQSEKLTRAQVRSVVLEFLRSELISSGSVPKSIILRRDGRSFKSEWSGLKDAIDQLVKEHLLPSDVQLGMIEVHKTNAEGIRIVEESNDKSLRNPSIGAWQIINSDEGIVCTTGFPFSFSGTVKPLVIRISQGDLDLQKILEDTFGLSQLCWPVPDRCMRLSIDLKLCDDNLRASSSLVDEDEGQFGEDEDVETEYEDRLSNSLAT